MQSPTHLDKETGDWFQQVLADYELEPHHLKLLTLAAEAWQRCQQARKALKKHGLTYTDRFNQPHARPEVGIERDSRIAFARLLRELDLDIEAPPENPARPPSINSNRGRSRAR